MVDPFDFGSCCGGGSKQYDFWNHPPPSDEEEAQRAIESKKKHRWGRSSNKKESGLQANDVYYGQKIEEEHSDQTNDVYLGSKVENEVGHGENDIHVETKRPFWLKVIDPFRFFGPGARPDARERETGKKGQPPTNHFVEPLGQAPVGL